MIHQYLPHPADIIVNDFVTAVCRIIPDTIEGIYLTGSITLNDFYPEKSDIDFIVLCRGLPNEKEKKELLRIHQQISRRVRKPDLSGHYLDITRINALHTVQIQALAYQEGKLRKINFELAPVYLWELTANAITVYGTKPESLPIRIDHATLNAFLFNNMNSYWNTWIRHHSSFLNRKVLLWLFPRLTEWVILGMARQLCTLETGQIVSKTEAGQYGLKDLPAKFHPVFRQAIDIRKDSRTYPLVRSYAIRPSLSRMRRTLECAYYINALFNSIYLKTHDESPS